MMRLFAGVELDAGVKAGAGRLAGRLQQHLGVVAPDLQVRWVREGNLHITIWFIGEVPEPRSNEVAQVLQAEPFRTAAFDLELAGCGVFPPSGRPRVLWVGVRQGAAGLAAVFGEVGARLAPLGFTPERRPFSAHLTIARVKDPGRNTSRTLRDALAAVPAECGRCGISAVTLFRSRLSPRGAAYEPLLRVPLST